MVTNYGVYRFFVDGQLVGEQANLITDRAKTVLLDYLAGRTGAWAGGVAVGIGEEEPSAEGTGLSFEVDRQPVSVKEPLYDSGAIVVKATLPLNLIVDIHEIGLFNTVSAPTEQQDNFILSRFRPDIDEIDGVNAVEGRLDAESAELALSGSSATATVEGLGISLNNASDRDNLLLACTSNNVSSVDVVLRFDDDETRSVNIGLSQGFGVYSFRLADMAGDGDFDRSINKIEVTANGSGGSTLVLEGLRYESVGAEQLDVLMSHATLATPRSKDAGEEMDIEFSITLGGLSA